MLINQQSSSRVLLSYNIKNKYTGFNIINCRHYGALDTNFKLKSAFFLILAKNGYYLCVIWIQVSSSGHPVHSLSVMKKEENQIQIVHFGN